MTAPLEALFAAHRRHYAPGTLERFRAWFANTGHGQALENPFLLEGASKATKLTPGSIPFEELRSLGFCNNGADTWRVTFAPVLEKNAKSVEDLFHNFVRCTGHTHLFGDFRVHIPHFVSSYSNSRYVLFDGAGTCLLLSAMFQALAARLLDEKIDLHYSHSENRELTHAFASWRGEYFVDPDQKTWVPMRDVDKSAIFGYVFQQLGVAAFELYRELDEQTREFLFAKMTRDYFAFYKESEKQYMYRRDQNVAQVSSYFADARARFCSPLSVDASDFAWKGSFREEAARQSVEKPYFLMRSGEPVTLDIPAGGRLDIGLDAGGLPEEASLLATFFLGRVPGALRLPLVDGHVSAVLPEFPWLVALPEPSSAVTVNGKKIEARRSRDGRFGIVGMGSLESVLDLSAGQEKYKLEIVAPGQDTVTIVLPFNAFALNSGLVQIGAPLGAGRSMTGRLAA